MELVALEVARLNKVKPCRSIAVCFAAALCVVATAAAQGNGQPGALPSGLTVAQGQVTAVASGNQLVVTNSANAILNWQSFSIGNGQSVRFDQPNSASQVLNRVTGSSPSTILGSLSSNGGVWLINPHGVLFGPNARVDVAGLVASALNISDVNWSARRYSLYTDGTQGTGSIVNQGEIRSSSGGRVMLVAGQGGVRNEGLIDAPHGQVAALSGRQIELVDTTSPFVSVRLDAPTGEVANLGRMMAPSGRVDIFAALVANRGLISADGTALSAAGSLELRATESLTLTEGSTTRATGRSGGPIALRGGITSVAGVLEARGTEGKGGEVQVLGVQAAVLSGATIDVSGSSGGGVVQVGGGPGGQDPTVPNATDTYLAPDATVRADATAAGDGGRIITWGNRSSAAYAHLSARGGPLGGNGGLVETSGGWLDARPSSLELGAPLGRAGLWLLDPYEIQIVSSGGLNADQNYTPFPPPLPPDSTVVPSATPSRILYSTLENALQTGNVTISTRNTIANPGGPEPVGNILMQGGTLRMTQPRAQPTTLTLDSPDGVTISSTIQSDAGAGLNLHIVANGTVQFQNNPNIQAGTGSVSIQANRLNAVSNTRIQAHTFMAAVNNYQIAAGARIQSTAPSGPAMLLQGDANQQIAIWNVVDPNAFSIEPQAHWYLFPPQAINPAQFSLSSRAPDWVVAVAPNTIIPRPAGNTFYYQGPLIPAQPTQATYLLPPPKETLEPDSAGHPTDGLFGEGARNFGPLDIDRMAAVELQTILAARREHRRHVFDGSLVRLSANPSPAELEDCSSAEQSLDGDCAVTPEIKIRLRQIASGLVPNLEPEFFCKGFPNEARKGACLGLMQQLTEDRGPKRYAIVIGIDKYRDKRVPRLHSGTNDSRKLTGLLEKRFGYESPRMILNEEATREEIFKHLNRVATVSREGDSVVIYFAGHGLTDNQGRGYWLATDFDPDRAYGAAANVNIGRLLRVMEASQILLIADSTFSGALVAKDAERQSTAASPPGKRAVVIMTAGRDEPVAEINGHSVFSIPLIASIEKVTSTIYGKDVHMKVESAVRSRLEEVDRKGVRLKQAPLYGGLEGVRGAGADFLFDARSR